MTSLRIITPPSSGAQASIGASGNLIINYNGISFAGIDRLTIEVCDLLGSCTQRELSIEVAGDVIAYNAISPNGDGKNDFLFFQYIEVLEETKNNQVSISNRWGDVVWEGVNYNNASVVFNGMNKNGDALSSGTYFYKITFSSNRKSETGFFTLKR